VAQTNWDVVIGSTGRKEILRFQLQMITRRTAMGWSHKDLKKAIADQGYNFNPETGSLFWKMVDTQAWCRILGGRLRVTFPGVPVPDTGELDQVMEAMAAVFKEDELDRYKAIRYLSTARMQAGVSIPEFAQRIGITTSATSTWEQNTESPMIPGLFRHAQALGGTVRLDFEELPLVKGPAGR